VPRISEFYAIVIAMYDREHGIAHLHATYAGETVVVAIETGGVEGPSSLPGQVWRRWTTFWDTLGAARCWALAQQV
jgi:hypothetical protein